VRNATEENCSSLHSHKIPTRFHCYAMAVNIFLPTLFLSSSSSWLPPHLGRRFSGNLCHKFHRTSCSSLNVSIKGACKRDDKKLRTSNFKIIDKLGRVAACGDETQGCPSLAFFVFRLLIQLSSLDLHNSGLKRGERVANIIRKAFFCVKFIWRWHHRTLLHFSDR
jgi:hypothetical protein